MKLSQNAEDKKLYEEAQKKCAEEKIRIPGSIQAYAYLIIFDECKNILKFSENLTEIVSATNEDIVFKNLKDIIHEKSIDQIDRHIQHKKYGADFILSTTLKNNSAHTYFAFLYHINGLFVLEIEQSGNYISNESYYSKSEFSTVSYTHLSMTTICRS